MRSIWNIFFIVGIAAAGFGVSLLVWQIYTERSCSEHTEGVIRTAYQHFAGKDIPYKELVYAVKGQEHCTPFSGSDTFDYGDTVTVRYNPSDPTRFYILEDKSNIRTLGLVFCIGGFLCLLIGYGVYLGILNINYRV